MTDVTGPASYFPSIEAKYGQPVSHWLGLIAGLDGQTHMQRVAWLKAEHGLGPRPRQRPRRPRPRRGPPR